MKFVRVLTRERSVRLCLVRDDRVVALVDREKNRWFTDFVEFLQAARDYGSSLREFSERCMADTIASYSRLERGVEEGAELLVPVNAPEVWGCGITYYISREARERETEAKGIYMRVYDAIRPEVFFKSTPNRYVGPNKTIFVRSDSNWTVPEPELSFVIGLDEEIVGYTIGNDVSARDIEGENPLYLPQAKIYKGSCSLGPAIVTTDEIQDPHSLEITMRILRKGEVVYEGSINTSRMKRKIPELYEYLRRDNILPPGLVCLTGTGIVPPDDFSLQEGDVVEIEIEKIGVLRNPVGKLR